MAGKSAFNWDIYKNRKTALQYLKLNCTLVDTILETEDGSAYELVHSQVISAFGEKLNEFISKNGHYVDSYKSVVFQANKRLVSEEPADGQQAVIPVRLIRGAQVEEPCSQRAGKAKLVRLALVNRYTLKILIECAYTGYIRTDLASGGIWQVLRVAQHYEMQEVIRACCAFLTKNLDRANCIHFYHIGVRHRHPLQRSAWHKIRANFKYILAQNLSEASDDELGQAPMELGEHSGLVPEWAGPAAAADSVEPMERRLASLRFEHLEPLLKHDKLNVDNEESVWLAIKLWVRHNLLERRPLLGELLACMRFGRFRQGTDFSARHLWRDPLVAGELRAQQALAVLDRNHRDALAATPPRDGFGLPAAGGPPLVRPRVPHALLLAIGGWQQGQPTSLIESYDANCNMWFESSKRIMGPLAYHGIELINGLLYICGGTDGAEILPELFTFDPIRGDCAQRPSMREPRCYVSTAYLSDHLYAMGGHNGVQRMKSVERFHLQSDSWAHVSDMNVARSDASACVLDARIYIAGGLNDQLIESSVEFYNQLDDTWTFASSMTTPRTSFTLLLYRGSLLAIGGNNGHERLASVERYDLAAKLWREHSQMRHRRSTFSAAMLDEQRLIVVGGYNGQTPFAQVETFDERSKQWRPLQRIRFDRSGLKVVAVSDLANAPDFTYLGSSQARAHS